MSKRYEDETKLTRAIGELPRSLPPGRDLWPQIEHRLGDRGATARTRRFGSPQVAFGAAAAVFVAFAAGILLGRQAGHSVPAGVAETAMANRSLAAVTQASEREYQAAFRQFTPIGAEQGVIGQQAAQSIEGSWQEMLEAEAALLAALEEYPENSYLNQRLLDLRSRQLQFMKQLLSLDQFSRRSI